jgi:hypothetical protein
MLQSSAFGFLFFEKLRHILCMEYLFLRVFHSLISYLDSYSNKLKPLFWTLQ